MCLKIVWKKICEVKNKNINIYSIIYFGIGEETEERALEREREIKNENI